MGLLETFIIGGLIAAAICAVILIIAYGIVWGAKGIFGIAIDGNVYKWGRILTMLLCAIVIGNWLFDVLNAALAMVGSGFRFPSFHYR